LFTACFDDCVAHDRMKVMLLRAGRELHHKRSDCASIFSKIFLLLLVNFHQHKLGCVLQDEADSRMARHRFRCNRTVR
jgi:hypothetical protein